MLKIEKNLAFRWGQWQMHVKIVILKRKIHSFAVIMAGKTIRNL